MKIPDSKLKPPPAGFAIFCEGPPSEMDAFINFLGDMSSGYQEGYRRAFRILVDHVKATNTSQDLLIYPILFVARQHIELTLKSLRRLINHHRRASADPEYTHDLARLWLPCRKFLLEQWPEDDHDWIAALDSLTDQFTLYDQKAEAFRFAVLKTKEKSLDGVKRINILDLFETMHPIMCWLCRVEAVLVEMNNIDDTGSDGGEVAPNAPGSH